MQDNFSQLEEEIGIHFNNRDLLRQAFCHRSYLNEHPDFGLGHNERLEFLGDAVLELAVTRFLFHEYPDKPEGELTSWRAALVNTGMLSKVGDKLNFGDYLLVSNGEAREQNEKARRYMLANVCEAFIGALYLDGGFERAEQFVREHILPEVETVERQQLYRDAKSALQEHTQDTEGETPAYEVLQEWGPDHNKRFRVGVYLGDRVIGEGEGTSKQEAEEAAARHALEELRE